LTCNATSLPQPYFLSPHHHIGLSIDPLYISEVAPPSHRGHLVSFSDISINVGVLLGAYPGLSIDQPKQSPGTPRLSTPHTTPHTARTRVAGFIADYAFLNLAPGLGWRLMLGLGVVIPCILIVLTFTVMPESPRWLLMKDRRNEAMAVLKRTYPGTTDFGRLAEEIRQTIQADFEADRGSTWHAILRPSPVVARMLLAGVGIAAVQPLTGIESFSKLQSVEASATGDWID
jgi:MFS family permease